MEGKLKFAVITNKNSVTCKNIFNYVRDNKIWSGKTRWSNEMRFKNDGEMKSVSAIWITNLEHGRRHQPMQLMTMADNRKFNKRVTKNKAVYQKYDNYNAIEVSYTEAIPSDYDKIMGVPISFLDKYCPEQFEILGVSESQGIGLSNGIWDSSSGKKHPLINGNKMYVRIFIKHKR
jgi:site-specific DNA-methyltransferase (adenine-specific)